MSVSIINTTPNLKPRRFKHIRNSNNNKLTQSSSYGVDDILNKYIKYKTDRGGLKDKINELDHLEYSISQLPFIRNTKLDLINRNIYDIVTSSINRHEFNNNQLGSDITPFYSVSEYNDLNNLLLQASFWGNLDDITRFLDMGADVNYSDRVGRSAIHYSTALGSVECVKYLISRGADVNAIDLKSWSSLHIAVTKNYTNVAILLIDAGADVKALLKHKCAPSRLVDVYSICIHFAAIKGNIEMTNLLVQKGLSVNDRDSANLTPVDYAAFRKNYRYLKYILDNGGRVDNTDVNNRTVLHSAALGGHVDNFKILLSKGANPRIRDNWGLTPYDLAVLRNHDKLIKFMEKTKCNIKGIDGVGGYVGPSLSDTVVANAISIALQEPKVDSIAMMVKCLGGELCLKLLEAALAVDRRGGMMTMDGKRKRSKGGIFFFLLKELYNNGHVSRDDYAYIKMLDKESKPKSVNVTPKENLKGLPHGVGKKNTNITENKPSKVFSGVSSIERKGKKNVNSGDKLNRYPVSNVLNQDKKAVITKDDVSNNGYLEEGGSGQNGQLNHKIQLLMLLQKFEQQLNLNTSQVDNGIKSTPVESAKSVVIGNTKNGRKGH